MGETVGNIVELELRRLVKSLKRKHEMQARRAEETLARIRALEDQLKR